MKSFASIAAALAIILAPAFALAQDSIREVRVPFPPWRVEQDYQGFRTPRWSVASNTPWRSTHPWLLPRSIA